MVVALGACGGSAADAPTTASTGPSTTVATTTTLPPTTTTSVPPTTTTLPPAGPARYRLVVTNTWSEATHPGAVPANAHFSFLAGATHQAATSLWAIGEPATPGVTEMAETGQTDILVNEIDALEGVGTPLDWPWWFCAETTQSSKCGDLTVEFDVDPDFPYLTLAAMIGPSPDWFVGVDSLLLQEDGQWRRIIEWALFPHDAGTRTSNRFALFGPQNDPPDPITQITADSEQIIGPQLIGTYRLELIDDE